MTIPTISELDLPDDALLQRILTAVTAHPEIREPLMRALLTEEFLNLPTEVKELREEMREGFRAVNERIDSLDERVDETNRSLGERIDETNRSLGERIDETNRSLGERIDETNRSLGERIDETNRSLGERIDETNRSLGERIDETNRSLGERIDETNRSLGERIDETNRSLGERIDETNRSLGERIDETNHSLGERIDETNHSLGERIDANRRAINGLTGQMGELRGESYERRCSERIGEVLVDYFDHAALADRIPIIRRMQEARRNGIITRREYESARNVDIIAQEAVGGDSPERLAVVEATITFNRGDLQNAAERAELIGRLTGIPTAAFTVTREDWPEAANETAGELGVTIIQFR